MRFGEQFELFRPGEQPPPSAEIEKEEEGGLRGGVERSECQYCQDVGTCMYCNRGREETRALTKKPPAPLFKHSRRRLH